MNLTLKSFPSKNTAAGAPPGLPLPTAHLPSPAPQGASLTSVTVLEWGPEQGWDTWAISWAASCHL